MDQEFPARMRRLCMVIEKDDNGNCGYVKIRRCDHSRRDSLKIPNLFTSRNKSIEK